MLLHVPLGVEAGALKKKRKAAEQKPAKLKVAPGALLSGTVTSVHAMQAAVQMESGMPLLLADMRASNCCPPGAC